MGVARSSLDLSPFGFARDLVFPVRHDKTVPVGRSVASPRLGPARLVHAPRPYIHAGIYHRLLLLLLPPMPCAQAEPFVTPVVPISFVGSLQPGSEQPNRRRRCTGAAPPIEVSRRARKVYSNEPASEQTHRDSLLPLTLPHRQAFLFSASTSTPSSIVLP